MKQINLLRNTLNPLLSWHGTRLSFLALFLIALLRVTRSPEFNSGACESPLVKTINLTEVATGFRNTAEQSSNYKPLQGFFKNYELDYSLIAKAIVTLMDLPQPWILSHLQPGEKEILNSRRWVWGRLVDVSALRLEDGELLIVISPDSPETAISDYATRWGMVALSHSSQGALSDARETRARVAPQSEETWAKRKKSFSLRS